MRSLRTVNTAKPTKTHGSYGKTAATEFRFLSRLGAFASDSSFHRFPLFRPLSNGNKPQVAARLQTLDVATSPAPRLIPAGARAGAPASAAPPAAPASGWGPPLAPLEPGP